MYAAAPQVRSTVPEPMCTDPLKLMCLSFETMTNSNRNICVIFDVMRMLNSVADYMPLSIGAASQPASQPDVLLYSSTLDSLRSFIKCSPHSSDDVGRHTRAHKIKTYHEWALFRNATRIAFFGEWNFA